MRTEERLVALLLKTNQRITFAESCTGGLVSAAVTSVAGSSAVYDGGLCSYANRIKNGLLGVSETVLDTLGAVSAKCAAQMAEGALALFSADVAVSVTGIAGPGGGTPEKPVGTVFICAQHINGERLLKKCLLKGGRNEVRRKSTEVALRTAIELIEKTIK